MERHRAHWVSYDDPQPPVLKAGYVKQWGLGGIMCREQRGDDNAQRLDVPHNALHGAR